MYVHLTYGRFVPGVTETTELPRRPGPLPPPPPRITSLRRVLRGTRRLAGIPPEAAGVDQPPAEAPRDEPLVAPPALDLNIPPQEDELPRREEGEGVRMLLRRRRPPPLLMWWPSDVEVSLFNSVQDANYHTKWYHNSTLTLTLPRYYEPGVNPTPAQLTRYIEIIFPQPEEFFANFGIFYTLTSIESPTVNAYNFVVSFPGNMEIKSMPMMVGPLALIFESMLMTGHGLGGPIEWARGNKMIRVLKIGISTSSAGVANYTSLSRRDIARIWRTRSISFDKHATDREDKLDIIMELLDRVFREYEVMMGREGFDMSDPSWFMLEDDPTHRGRVTRGRISSFSLRMVTVPRPNNVPEDEDSRDEVSVDIDQEFLPPSPDGPMDDDFPLSEEFEREESIDF